jgi:DNA/RNA-binding domain of Phe-tRNA-synthetase-like protein
MIAVEPHDLLDLQAFVTRFPRPLGRIEAGASGAIARGLAADAEAPLSATDEVRRAVRDLLRAGGFKPAGRSKPASEYLARAAKEGGVAAINPAVDACNVVSLHSGLPISLVDLDRAVAPLRVAIAGPGSRYVFNRSGQEIDVAGLLCLHDAEGPCANAVKDSMRTKTTEETTRTLSLVWGAVALPGRASEAVSWYRRLLEELGAETEAAPLT